MPRRTAKPKPFDEATYALIVELIDGAEDSLVEHGICKPEAAGARLALNYIICVTDFITGANQYILSDERTGAFSFLDGLPNARKKLKSPRRREACIDMLFERPSMFLPEYGTVLRYLMTRVLAQPGELKWSAILRLAAATLPGARAEIRRELRRRGESNTTLVCDQYMERRMLPANELDSILHYGIPKLESDDSANR